MAEIHTSSKGLNAVCDSDLTDKQTSSLKLLSDHKRFRNPPSFQVQGNIEDNYANRLLWHILKYSATHH